MAKYLLLKHYRGAPAPENMGTSTAVTAAGDA